MVPVRIFGACALLAMTMAVGRPAATADERPHFFAVSFDSEWIRLAVVDDSLEVQGTYYLVCRPEARVSLFYPFPEDSLMGGARMVSLHASTRGAPRRELDWEEGRAGAWGIRFHTPPCAGDTIVIDAVYRQALRTNYARYIVTTTRSWRRPLSLARFEIRLPPGAIPIEFSYPFEPRMDSIGPYYGFESRGFFPDRDVTVRWRPADTR